MANETSGQDLQTSPDGSSQGATNDAPFDVAPATDGTQANHVSPGFPRPIACWRLYDQYFAFDSSVIHPSIAGQLQRLRAILPDTEGTSWALTLFGHADPVGDDAYNKQLSGRRVRALYALLTRDVDAWLELFSDQSADIWGLRSTQLMLATLRNAAGQAYYGGTVNGQFTDALGAAIRRFQADNGLSADGVAGPGTRRVIYSLYMNAICIQTEDPFKLPPEAFLGDRAASDGKAAYQGCSEFNPVRILAKKEQKNLRRDQRNERNAVNRRVLGLVFSRADFAPLSPATIAKRWPCPTWKEGPSGCKSRFWSNSKQRLAATDSERNFPDDPRTMACSWYDRLARLSPCERVSSAGVVRIWLLDHFGQRMGKPPASSGSTPSSAAPWTGIPYRISFESGEVYTGRATDEGLVEVSGVPVSRSCRLEWGVIDSESGATADTVEYLYSERIFLDTNRADQNVQERRLRNLGYSGAASVARTAFREDYGADDDGTIADAHQNGTPRRPPEA